MVGNNRILACLAPAGVHVHLPGGSFCILVGGDLRGVFLLARVFGDLVGVILTRISYV